MSRKKRRQAQERAGNRNAPSAPRPGILRETVLPAAAIALVAILAYLPAMKGAFLWDDPRYVSHNPVLSEPGGLARIWTKLGATVQYYPMVFTTFRLEHHFWQLDTLGYHLDNVLLHALTAILIGLVLRRLPVPGAWLGAALFAFHPLQVESVAWITERKNVLSGAFYAAAALAYLHFDPLDDADGRRRWSRYALSFVLFLGALFSKTVTASLPAAIVLVAWWKRARLTRRRILPLVPMFAAGLVMARVTAWMEANNVRSVGRDWDLSFAERILVAGRALWFYLAKLALPFRLTFNYPRWSIDAGAAWQWLFPLGAVALVGVLWVLRRRIGRAPLTAALFFGGTLLPALGFTDVYPMRYSFVADHFQYLAGIGPLALAAAGLTRWLGAPGRAGRTGGGRAGVGAPRALYVVGAVLLVTLAGLTFRQARAYRNRTTLWEDTLAKNPSSFLANNNLGTILLDSGDVDGAVERFRNAVRLKPDFHEAQSNLGRALALQGNLEEAETHCAEAVRLKPDSPDAHYNLANVLAGRRKFPEAIEQYEAALRLGFSPAVVHNNLGNVLAQTGKLADAIEHYQDATRLDPGYALAWANLGRAWTARGQGDDAARAYREAIHLRPDDVASRMNLATLLEKRGEKDAAAREYREALRLEPRLAAAREGLRRTGSTSPAPGK